MERAYLPRPAEAKDASLAIHLMIRFGVWGLRGLKLALLPALYNFMYNFSYRDCRVKYFFSG